MTILMPRTLCVQLATFAQVQEVQLRVRAALQAQAGQQLALHSSQHSALACRTKTLEPIHTLIFVPS